MINKIKRPFLAAIFLLALSVTLQNCKTKSSDIGIGLQPENDLLGVAISDSIALEVRTESLTDLTSTLLGAAPIGYYNDPLFGDVSASIFTQIGLATSNLDLGDEATLVADSLVLQFRYAVEDKLYGEASVQEVNIFELTEEISLDSVYTSEDVLATEMVNLVHPDDALTNFDPEELVRVITPASGTMPADTTFVETSSLNIRLSDALAQEFASYSGTDVFSTNDMFKETFKGLHISVGQTGAGAVRVNLKNPLSTATLYYRDLVGSEDEIEKTQGFTFLTGSGFTNISHDYTGTDFDGIQANEDGISGDVSTYVQAGGGLRTSVTIPNIDSWRNLDKPLVINKATLIVPISEMTNELYTEPLTLKIFQDTENGLLDTGAIIQNNSTFDEDEQEYSFLITDYFQNLVSDQAGSNKLVIQVEDELGGFVTNSLNRVVLNGPNHPTAPMRLEIVTTK